MRLGGGVEVWCLWSNHVSGVRQRLGVNDLGSGAVKCINRYTTRDGDTTT